MRSTINPFTSRMATVLRSFGHSETRCVQNVKVNKKKCPLGISGLKLENDDVFLQKLQN